MIKKFPVIKLLSRLGVWTLPLISVTSLPLLWTHWQTPEAPPLRQLPPLARQWQTPLITEDPLISRPTSLQSPHARQKSPKPQPQASTPAKPQATSAKATTPSQKGDSAPRLVPSPNYAPPPLEIKVAILRDEPSTTIGTSAQAAILDRNGKVLQSLAGNQGVLVQANGSGLTVGDRQLPPVIWVQPADGSFVYAGDHWYRGKILLVSQGSTLLAVNHVNLEQYLYSVVGSEMHPTAPREALKAQAIAARSYALVHIIRPASAWFDLGNNQRWQVYKGIGSEYNTTHQAVNETAGQVLSYKGGVVESLYASTEDIVNSAHGGQGMSQTGAYELANKGYEYVQILANYYPGVGLARLILQR